MPKKYSLCTILFASISTVIVAQQPIASAPVQSSQRDSSAIDILNRTATAAGGLKALSQVRDVTETGQLTLFLDRTEAGAVNIQLLGTSRFRMDADLPRGKATWIADGEAGSKQKGKQKEWMAASSAANLGALTFPGAFISVALADQRTSVRLIGIEQKSGRSVYRIRIRGKLLDGSHPSNLEKDLVIDALTFDVIAVNDQPLPMYMSQEKSVEIGPREIDFGDFRSVQSIRIPFSIVSSLHGQATMNVTLTDVSINTNLSQQEFEP
jgi:hypothetical protein